MTESSFPFQGTPVADGPADLEESRGNRRTVLILAVVGVLVLGALAYFFVFSGGDDPADESLPVRPSTGSVVTPTPAPTAAPVKAPKLSKKLIGKDPFKPLVVAPVEGSDTAGGAVVPPAGSGATVNPPAAGGGIVAGGGSSAGGGTAGASDPGTSTKPVNVKVISVASDNSSGRVTVGTKAYSVAVGDVFGTYFKVLRLKNGKCGSFSYGDERFDLCEGETSKMQ
jgi:hypothetical protein